ASRARGHAVANPAARSGIATKSPTTGIGLEIGSHPAPATAAARPIQRPITTANVTLAAREASIKDDQGVDDHHHQGSSDDQADEIEHVVRTTSLNSPAPSAGRPKISASQAHP